MSAPPQWAQDLLLDALLYWQEQHGGDLSLPALVWRRRKVRVYRRTGKPDVLIGRASSSGRCWPDRIVVTAGHERLDQRLVLLHETAHALQPHKHHSAEFWDTAWALYRWARLPIAYARQRERGYRKEADAAYLRNRTLLAAAHKGQGRLIILTIAQAKRQIGGRP